jgi:hypothetical protein
MRWSLLWENAVHVLGETWFVLLVLLLLSFAMRCSVLTNQSGVHWTSKRTRFVRVTAAIAELSPLVLLVLATIWHRPYQVDIESLEHITPPPEFLPPTPPETMVPMRLQTCVVVAVLGVAALASVFVAAKGRRNVTLAIGLGLVGVILFTWVYAGFAVTGAWI